MTSKQFLEPEQGGVRSISDWKEMGLLVESELIRRYLTTTKGSPMGHVFASSVSGLLVQFRDGSAIDDDGDILHWSKA